MTQETIDRYAGIRRRLDHDAASRIMGAGCFLVLESPNFSEIAEIEIASGGGDTDGLELSRIDHD